MINSTMSTRLEREETMVEAITNIKSTEAITIDREAADTMIMTNMIQVTKAPDIEEETTINRTIEVVEVDMKTMEIDNTRSHIRSIIVTNMMIMNNLKKLKKHKKLKKSTIELLRKSQSLTIKVTKILKQSYTANLRKKKRASQCLFRKPEVRELREELKDSAREIDIKEEADTTTITEEAVTMTTSTEAEASSTTSAITMMKNMMIKMKKQSTHDDSWVNKYFVISHPHF